MERPFYFLLEAEPTSASPQAHDIAGAVVKAFVMADSLDQAWTRIREALIDYAWLLKKTHLVQELPPPPDERAVQLGKVEFELYCRALVLGMAVDFEAWPKDGVSGLENVVRPLGPPLIKDV